MLGNEVAMVTIYDLKWGIFLQESKELITCYSQAQLRGGHSWLECLKICL